MAATSQGSPSRFLAAATLTASLCVAVPARAEVGRWTAYGPRCCGIELLAVDRGAPGAPGAAWASVGGALVRSDDRGAHWRPVDRDLPATAGSVAAMAADLSRPAALWAATGREVLRTEDRGAHWVRLSDPSYAEALGEGTPIRLIAAGRSLFVRSYQRLIGSDDGGATWKVLYEVGENAYLGGFAAQSTKPPTLYLATVGPETPDLVRSTDGGRTWASLTVLSLPPAGIAELTATGGAVYALLGGDSAGLFRSGDRGVTWAPILGGRPNDRFDGRALVVDPRAPRTLYVYGGQPETEPALWVSRNAGGSWRRLSPGPIPAIIEPGTRVVYGYATSFLRTLLSRSLDGGATWEPIFTGSAPDSEVAQHTFRRGKPAEQALTIGYALYRTDDAGTTWRSVPSPFLDAAEIDPDDPRILIGVGRFSAYRSTDGGATWETTSRNLEYAENLVRLTKKTLLAGGCGVARTADGGKTWKKTLACFNTFTDDPGRWTQKFETDPAHPSTVYVLGFLALFDGLPHGILTDFPSFLWKSEDGGQTWKKIARNLRAFALDRTGGRLYGARDRNLLASDDRGASWHPVGRMPAVPDDLATDPSRPGLLYLSTFNGSFACSPDGGGTWENLPSGTDLALRVDPGNARTVFTLGPRKVSQITIPPGRCE